MNFRDKSIFQGAVIYMVGNVGSAFMLLMAVLAGDLRVGAVFLLMLCLRLTELLIRTLYAPLFFDLEAMVMHKHRTSVVNRWAYRLLGLQVVCAIAVFALVV